MKALPIPKPHVLDPDRLLRDNREHQVIQDHRARAELLDTALHESCAYAAQLWDNLNAIRQYLLDSLPPDPHAATNAVAIGAAPTGPDDEPGWQNWMSAFAAITSMLCGPHGDSGFGLSRAREEAQRRRMAPPTEAPQAGHAEDEPSRGPTEPVDAPIQPQERTERDGRPQDNAPQERHRYARGVARSAGTAVLIALTLRGLRSRQARPDTVAPSRHTA
jgi:hypothetical protein